MMNGLGEIHEKVLKCVIDNVSRHNKIHSSEIYIKFEYEDDLIFAVLEELHAGGYIRFIVPDCDINGTILLLPKGKTYFYSKQSDNSSNTVFNIGNVSNSVIGNNNDVDFNITQAPTFEEIFSLVDKLQSDNKTLMLEIVEAFKDSIENSKPLPKGKFQKILEYSKDLLPVFANIGAKIAEHLTK